MTCNRLMLRIILVTFSLPALCYSQSPNLTPYVPVGWSDRVVVSRVAGTSLDSSPLTSADPLYVDWAVINNGSVTTGVSFQVKLYFDGVERPFWTASVLSAGFYTYVTDYAMGSLTAGTHTVRVVADPSNAVAESNEADNEYTKVISVLAPPNLTTYRPTGWTAPIVVSTQTATSVDSASLTTNDSLYLDFAILNNGASPVTTSFQVKLYVDGVERASFPVFPPLNPSIYLYWTDYSLGRLAAGTHSLRIVADPLNAVVESNETDNEYIRTITVVQGGVSCLSLKVSVSPVGSGTVSKHQSDCGVVSLTTASTLFLENEPPAQDLRKPEKITREKFSQLLQEAQTQGRVRVIVGLKRNLSEQRTAGGAAPNLESEQRVISAVQEDFLAQLKGKNISNTYKFKYIPFIALSVDANSLQFLQLSPEVSSIEENGIGRALLAESAPLIGAPAAWAAGYSGAGQTVAILDTGVDKTHPFLSGKVVSEACFSNTGGSLLFQPLCPGGVRESILVGSALPCSLGCEHGTHVSGIAAGKGTFSGVARDASIIAVQVFSRPDPLVCLLADEPTTCVRVQQEDVLRGLQRIIELSQSSKIAAVNLSLGGGLFPGTCDDESPSYKAKIEALKNLGIGTVVSGGNDFNKDPRFGLSSPACISTAISVGSTDDGSCDDDDRNCTIRDFISDFSKRSPSLSLLAPGRWIRSSVTPNQTNRSYLSWSGTSMAAPHVAGAWAVMKQKFPNASVSQILSALQTSGAVINIPGIGIKPRIQLDAALNSLASEEGYGSGTTVTLTANPSAGYQFKGWSGCSAPAGNQCTVTMTGTANVTALFEPVGATGVDLLLTSVSGSATVVAGGQISLATTIKNQGNTSAGSFRLGSYLSTDSTITTSDLLFAVCDYASGLAAGITSTCSGAVTLPSSVSPGNYYLGAIIDDLGQVPETNESNNSLVGPTVVRVIASEDSSLFVPIVLSAAGLNNSFFTSELTMTNLGSQPAQPQFSYAAAFGDGGGTASDYLGPGQQRVIPDAIAYLRSIGVSIPDSGNRGGTLSVRFSGLASRRDVGVTVRTTTSVSAGRAGLAYAGIQTSGALTAPSYICGLRQNDKDRSNVAIQNAGMASQGNIAVRLTVFSGDSQPALSAALPDETLAPGEFRQITGILNSNGLSLKNGFVRVERVSGSAPYYAYGVVNDQFNSDGSFIPPIPENTMAGKKRLTLPVVVEANAFSSEVIVTNWSSVKKSLLLRFVADAIQTANTTATLSMEVPPGQQLVLPDFVEYLRGQGVPGIGPRGSAYVGAMFVEAGEGDLAGVFVSARTSSPGGGGRFGLFYGSIPEGSGSSSSVSILGLQQNFENRSNLAIVNTGEVDGSSSAFRIELFNGATGVKVNTIDGIAVKAGGWKQLGAILAEFGPGVSQGYATITRMSGSNPFIAYGVINDGGQAGERTGDGAFIPSFP